MKPDVIVCFIDQLREKARERPAITANDIARIEGAMIGLRKAAQELAAGFPPLVERDRSRDL